MNETKTTIKELENQVGKQTNWVFIPLLKNHILKRTDAYILFDVDGIASGIISAKFLRKKETDEMVFLSVPEDYEVNVRVRDKINGKWQTTLDMKVKAVDLVERIKTYNKQ